MSNARPILLFALLLLGFLLFQAWQQDYGPQPAGSTEQPLVASDALVDTAVPTIDRGEQVPGLALQPSDSPPGDSPTSRAPGAGDLITVRSDVLRLEISTVGGEVQYAELLDYPLELKQPEAKVSLLSGAAADRFVAQSGLISATHDAPNHHQLFASEQRSYELAEGADELTVPLTWRGDDGVVVTKTWRIRRGSYELQLEQTVDNQSASAWRGAQYQQLLRRKPPEVKKGYSDPSRFSFTGAALYSSEQKYEEFDFEDFSSASYPDQNQAWVAMVQHYFFTAWIPPADQAIKIEANQTGSGANAQFRVSAVSPLVSVAPGAKANLTSTLFVGPKLQEQLDDIAQGLNLTVDYGVFTPLSKVLFWIMNKIHAAVGNWGVAIVLLTVLVKAVFYKLSEAQFRSAAKQRKLQPRIKALRERLGDDKQKLNMEIMQLFQKEKVNPLGGCLPLLVQLPVFFALYWVLLESVELRQAPFILWLQDLSSPDPFFVLPVINGAAMFATMKLSPNPMADPMQQRIFTAMPVVMSIMFAFFQSGLVLYWATNAVLSLLQQWFITRKFDREGA